MADDLGERTEQATPKRMAEAREEGNVAKSQDLSSAMALLGATLVLAVAAMSLLGQGRMMIGGSLDSHVMSSTDPTTAWASVRWIGAIGLRAAAPVLLLAWVASYLAQFVQTGFLFAPKSAQPKFSKLNPINGFKRLFGISAVVKSGIDTLKVAMVVVVTLLSIAGYGERILVLPYLSAMQALAEAGQMLFVLAIRILAVLLAIGLIDYLYQRWKHANDMKMTKQQVKDEMKQTEGDPEVKRRRVRMQRQIAMQRISAAVPRADVVVTNPEHISIAIQYDPAKMNAPKVVAKGADYLAMRIRVIAMQHGIPIVERKPLARAMYKQVAVNQEVPPEFYKAVAEILAYVYRLGNRRPVRAANA